MAYSLEEKTTLNKKQVFGYTIIFILEGQGMFPSL